MRDYEIVYIFRSSLTSEEIEGKLDRYHSIITTEGEGEITASAQWGKRAFAYPIKKQRNGYYVVVRFSANPACLEELERVIKLDEGVLRYLIVLSEPPLPPLETEAADGEADEAAEADETEEADEAAAESSDEASDETPSAEGDAGSDDPQEADEAPAPDAEAVAEEEAENAGEDEDEAEEASAGEDPPDGEDVASGEEASEEEEQQTETEDAAAETDADAAAEDEEEE